MNKELITHIVKTELRWKRKQILLAFMISLTALTLYILIGNHEEKVFPLIFFGTLLPFMITFTSSILTSPNQQINGTNQSDNFSWKYLHTIVYDRKNFIIGYCLAGVALLSPILLNSIILLIYEKIPLSISTEGIITATLLTLLIRLFSIGNVINFPRRTYYQYYTGSGITGWLLRKLSLLHLLIHYVALLGSALLLISFVGGFNEAYALIPAIPILLLYLVLTYNYVLEVWADERCSKWNVKRESKKTIFYVIIAISLVILNIHYHGRLLDNDSEIFDSIANSQISVIKTMNLNDHKLSLTNDNNLTPLHYAIFKNNLSIAQLLLEKGANIELKITGFGSSKKYYNGMTPLIYAVDQNRTEIVKLLLEKGASVNSKKEDSLGALSIASFRCNMDVMRSLIHAGANINENALNGHTPLFTATQHRGCLSAILFLKQLGADETIRNKNGQTYLEFAKEKNPVFYNELTFFYEKLSPIISDKTKLKETK